MYEMMLWCRNDEWLCLKWCKSCSATEVGGTQTRKHCSNWSGGYPSRVHTLHAGMCFKLSSPEPLLCNLGSASTLIITHTQVWTTCLHAGALKPPEGLEQHTAAALPTFMIANENTPNHILLDTNSANRICCNPESTHAEIQTTQPKRINS